MKDTTETDAVNLKLKQEIGYPGVVGLAGRVIGLANDRGAGAGGAAMTTTCQIKGPDCREPRDELGVTACEQCGLLGCANCVPDHDEHATELLCPRCEAAAEDLDLDALDPGIRDVVEALLEAGFKTTDSGDGVSKAACPEVSETPHVAMTPAPDVPGAGQVGAVLNVLTAVRPGERWQVDYTISGRSTAWRWHDPATLIAWRMPDDRVGLTKEAANIPAARSGQPVTQYADPTTGVLAAAQAIQALYAINSCWQGGVLHVVVDDLNVERLPSREWIEGLFFDEDEDEERAATLAVRDALEPLPPCHRMAAIILREELDGRRKDGPVGPSKFCRIVDDYDLCDQLSEDVDRAYDALKGARRQLSGAPHRDIDAEAVWPVDVMARDAMAVWSAIRVALDNDGRIEDIETVHRLAWSVTAAATAHARTADPELLSSRSRPIFRQVGKEMDRQAKLWGWPKPFPVDRQTPDNLRPILKQLEAIARENQPTRAASSFPNILAEEVCEALRTEGADELADELVQVAAVAASWLLALRGREKPKKPSPQVTWDGYEVWEHAPGGRYKARAERIAGYEAARDAMDALAGTTIPRNRPAASGALFCVRYRGAPGSEHCRYERALGDWGWEEVARSRLPSREREA